MTLPATVSSPEVARVVLSHIVGVLDRTPVEATPFSHVYVENVFPRDVYSAMLERLPAIEHYRADNPRKKRPGAAVLGARTRAAHLVEGLVHISSSRYTLPLNAVRLSPLPREQGAIWSGLADALTSPDLKKKIFTLFADDLCRRFRTDRQGLERMTVYPRATLVRDLSGYWIAPHPDIRAKVVTVQFYLARDLSQRELGTALYVRHLFNPRNLISLRNMFEEAKRMAFVPNSGYAFPVGRRTWHGRETVPEGTAERNSILLFYYRDAARE